MKIVSGAGSQHPLLQRLCSRRRHTEFGQTQAALTLLAVPLTATQPPRRREALPTPAVSSTSSCRQPRRAEPITSSARARLCVTAKAVGRMSAMEQHMPCRASHRRQFSAESGQRPRARIGYGCARSECDSSAFERQVMCTSADYDIYDASCGMRMFRCSGRSLWMNVTFGTGRAQTRFA
jgi:hypothetical protein